MTNMITSKPDAREYTDPQKFIDDDNAYNAYRATLGQAGGRAGHAVEDLLADIIAQAHRAGLSRAELERMSGAKYQNIGVNPEKNTKQTKKQNLQGSAFTRAGQERRFGNWTTARRLAIAALDAGIITPTGTVSTRTIAKDVRRVAKSLNVNVLELKRADYEKLGRFDTIIMHSRMGSWNDIVSKSYDMFVNHDWEDIR